MGTIQKGILGGFSGTVGTVVGGTWKGIDYMRSKSNRRNFTPSLKQLEQQLKFALMMRFLQPMSGLLKYSFHDFAIKKTGINSALSYNLLNAVSGVYPAFTIAYPQVLISRGDLPNALAPAVTSGAGSILTFSWTSNSGVGAASDKDASIFVAYCPVLMQSIYTIGTVTRGDLAGDLNLASFAGKDVETYIGFISTDGYSVANSIYTGTVTVS